MRRVFLTIAITACSLLSVAAQSASDWPNGLSCFGDLSEKHGVLTGSGTLEIWRDKDTYRGYFTERLNKLGFPNEQPLQNLRVNPRNVSFTVQLEKGVAKNIVGTVSDTGVMRIVWGRVRPRYANRVSNLYTLPDCLTSHRYAPSASNP